MYSYIKGMCAACPGCTLANTTKNKSSELVYNFPIEMPFLVLFVDAYCAGKHSSFDGFKTYLVACCGMTSFASMETVQHANSNNFASAIMKIQLRYGFCHTIVLDKDGKFNGVCGEALDLLHINCHVFSGDNHNPMMVEHVDQYLVKGLKIMTNEHDSVLSASFSMHGTLVPYPAQTSLGAWLLLAVNLPFQSITPPTSIGSSLLHQSVLNLIQRTLPHVFLPFAKLPSCLSRNTALTIVSSSFPIVRILAHTQLATLYFPTVLFNLMHPKNVSTNCPNNSLDLDVLSRPSKALHTSSNIAPHQIGRRRNMHQIYLLIQWS
jgi:hypothetical protein